MITRISENRFRVQVCVWKAGRKEKTLNGTREEAKVIEREFSDQLWAIRKKKNRPGSLIKYISEALDHYSKKRDGVPLQQSSTWKRLFTEIGHKPIDQCYSALTLFVEHHRRDGALAASSINRHIAMLKARVLDGHQRLLPENYLSSFPTLEENNKSYLVLNGGQIRQFWNALGDSIKPFFYFSCRVPIREGEAINIRREHINLFQNSITLPYGYTKNGIMRQIKIMPEMQQYVRDFVASPAEYLFNRGAPDYLPLGYVKNGKVQFSLKKSWKRAAIVAGAPKFNLHKTRQQAVMTLWAQGWPEGDIMLYGGWREKAAFDYYFNSEMALWIRQGQHTLDTTWIDDFAGFFVKPIRQTYPIPDSVNETQIKNPSQVLAS
jgi:integrase